MKRFAAAAIACLLASGLMGGSAHPMDWHEHDGHWYALTDAPMTWTAAESVGVACGGHLVTVNSLDENNWIVSTFGSDPLWIGLVQDPQGAEPNGGWGWSSGEALSLTHWFPGEPNNIVVDEDYGMMNYHDDMTGYWNDIPVDGINPVYGGSVPHGVIELTFPAAAPAREYGVSLPLMTNAPNPARRSTNLSFFVPQPSVVRITIHDFSGRWIGSIFQGFSNGGHYTRTWAATDELGRPLPAGIYFLRLQCGDDVVVRPMTILQ